jgi:hypothetical protein
MALFLLALSIPASAKDVPTPEFLLEMLQQRTPGKLDEFLKNPEWLRTYSIPPESRAHYVYWTYTILHRLIEQKRVAAPTTDPALGDIRKPDPSEAWKIDYARQLIAAGADPRALETLGQRDTACFGTSIPTC